MATNKFKKFRIESFNQDGSVYNGIISDVAGFFFTKTINGGGGEMRLRLPRPIDDYGFNVDVGYMYRLNAYVIDNDDPNGKQVYSGFIDTFGGNQRGAQEYIDINTLSYHAMMAEAPYKNGNNPNISHRSVNADVIFQDIIDKYLLYHTDSPINYTVSSVETGGNVISDDFNGLNCLEALDRLMKKAGSEWFWYLDGENVIHFKQKPSTPTHSFIYGKHVTRDFSFDKSIREVVNEGGFWNGRTDLDEKNISRLYRKTENQASYWKRYKKVSDQRITREDYADDLMEAYLEANHTENHGIAFSIVDNTYSEKGYDIESIEPGDTCEILNIKDEQVFSNNMLITAVGYSMERVVLRLEDYRTLTSRKLNDVRKGLDETTYNDGKQPDFTEIVI